MSSKINTHSGPRSTHTAIATSSSSSSKSTDTFSPTTTLRSSSQSLTKQGHLSPEKDGACKSTQSTSQPSTKSSPHSFLDDFEAEDERIKLHDEEGERFEKRIRMELEAETASIIQTYNPSKVQVYPYQMLTQNPIQKILRYFPPTEHCDFTEPFWPKLRVPIIRTISSVTPSRFSRHDIDPWASWYDGVDVMSICLLRNEDGTWRGKPASFLVFSVSSVDPIKSPGIEFKIKFQSVNNSHYQNKSNIHIQKFIPQLVTNSVIFHSYDDHSDQDRQYNFPDLKSAFSRFAEPKFCFSQYRSHKPLATDASKVSSKSGNSVEKRKDVKGNSEKRSFPPKSEFSLAPFVDISDDGKRYTAHTYHTCPFSTRLDTFIPLDPTEGHSSIVIKLRNDHWQCTGQDILPKNFRFALIVTHDLKPFYPQFHLKCEKRWKRPSVCGLLSGISGVRNCTKVVPATSRYDNWGREGIIRPLEDGEERWKLLQGRSSRQFERMTGKTEQKLMKV